MLQLPQLQRYARTGSPLLRAQQGTHDFAHHHLVPGRQALKIFRQGCGGIFPMCATFPLNFQHLRVFFVFPIMQPMGECLQPFRQGADFISCGYGFPVEPLAHRLRGDGLAQTAPVELARYVGGAACQLEAEDKAP